MQDVCFYFGTLHVCIVPRVSVRVRTHVQAHVLIIHE